MNVEDKLSHASALIRSVMGVGLTHENNKRLLRAIQEISQVRLATTRPVPGASRNLPDCDMGAVGDVDGRRD